MGILGIVIAGDVCIMWTLVAAFLKWLYVICRSCGKDASREKVVVWDFGGIDGDFDESFI